MSPQRSPFVLSVADLLGRDASPRPADVEATVEWKVELIAVDPDVPVEAHLMLHPVSGGVAVTGTVDFQTRDSCYRCLTVTTHRRSAAIGALFDRNDDDDETYPLEGTDIDVEQMLRDEVLLSLPLSPSCGEGCEGVVPDAGIDLNSQSSDDEGDARSPFAVLKDFLDSED